MPTESSQPKPGEVLPSKKDIKLYIRKVFYGDDKGRVKFTLELLGHAVYNVHVERAQRKYGEQKGYWIGHVIATAVITVCTILFSAGLTELLNAIGLGWFLLIVIGASLANLAMKMKRS